MSFMAPQGYQLNLARRIGSPKKASNNFKGFKPVEIYRGPTYSAFSEKVPFQVWIGLTRAWGANSALNADKKGVVSTDTRSPARGVQGLNPERGAPQVPAPLRAWLTRVVSANEAP